MSSIDVTLKEFQQDWWQVEEKAKNFNHEAYFALSGTEPRAFDGKTLTLWCAHPKNGILKDEKDEQRIQAYLTEYCKLPEGQLKVKIKNPDEIITESWRDVLKRFAANLQASGVTRDVAAVIAYNLSDATLAVGMNATFIVYVPPATLQELPPARAEILCKAIADTLNLDVHEFSLTLFPR